jgi:hypothetical protein
MKNLSPADRRRDVMDRAEMAEILEEIIRDPDTNPTARCTAIRTLLEIVPAAEPVSGFEGLYEVEPRHSGNGPGGS